MRRWAAATAMGLAVTGCAVPSTGPVGTVAPTARAVMHGAWQDRTLIMPGETLSDTAGRPYNVRTSPSRPVRVVYLGYIDCPDGCATTMADLVAARQRLDPSIRDDVEILFIDLRPDHDTAAELAAWLDTFAPDLVGLRGTPTQIQRIADELGIAVDPSGSDAPVAHSAPLIGFDRAGHGVIIWNPGVTPADLSADLARLVALNRGDKPTSRGRR